MLTQLAPPLLQVSSSADAVAAPSAARAAQALSLTLLRWAVATGQPPLLPARQLLPLAPAGGAAAAGPHPRATAAGLAAQYADGLEPAAPLSPAAGWAHAAGLATSQAAVRLLGTVTSHGPAPRPPPEVAASATNGGIAPGSGRVRGSSAADGGSGTAGGLSGADLRAWAAVPWPQGCEELGLFAVHEAAAAALPRCIADAAAGGDVGSGGAECSPEQAWRAAWQAAKRLVASVEAALDAAAGGGDGEAAGGPRCQLPQAAYGALAAEALRTEGGGPTLAASLLSAAACDNGLAYGRERWRWQWRRPSAPRGTCRRGSRSPDSRGRSRSGGLGRSFSSRSSWSGSGSASSSSSSWSCSRGRDRSSDTSRSRSRSRSRPVSHSSGSSASWTSGSSSRSRSHSRSHSPDSCSRAPRGRVGAAAAGLVAAAAKAAASLQSEEPEAGEIPGETLPVSQPRAAPRRVRRAAPKGCFRYSTSPDTSPDTPNDTVPWVRDPAAFLGGGGGGNSGGRSGSGQRSFQSAGAGEFDDGQAPDAATVASAFWRLAQPPQEDTG